MKPPASKEPKEQVFRIKWLKFNWCMRWKSRFSEFFTNFEAKKPIFYLKNQFLAPKPAKKLKNWIFHDFFLKIRIFTLKSEFSAPKPIKNCFFTIFDAKNPDFYLKNWNLAPKPPKTPFFSRELAAKRQKEGKLSAKQKQVMEKELAAEKDTRDALRELYVTAEAKLDECRAMVAADAAGAFARCEIGRKMPEIWSF